MNLAPVIERLDGAGIKAQDLSSLLKLRTAPSQNARAIFVVPERESGEAASAIVGMHDQWVGCDFMVVIYLNANAVAVDAELAATRATIEDRLVAWFHPDSEGFSTDFVGGRLFEFEGGKVAWIDSFRTRRRIRKQPTH